MPIYEYKCESCAAVMEKLQKLSDPALVECPKCGKPTLVKLVSAPSFRLKGSGWYETDFKTGAKKNGAGTETADSSADKATAAPPVAKSEAASSSKDSAAVPAKSGTTGSGGSGKGTAA